jgi:hypothetical protein
MNLTAQLRSRGPFRYLDSYDQADGAVYFGREREIRILCADIVVNRLVVLFAKTGTGKTSLINAGVRPRLDADYGTFTVRVERDPIEAATAVLRAAGLLLAGEVGAGLSEQLRCATHRLKRPVVLFFDQFEEFFEQIPYPEQRQRFVREVAEVYQDEPTAARIVFAMREEYFHGMDEFRDLVPSIFHRSSNLRLRPLSADQARQAIVRPLELFGVRIDPGLDDQIVADLETSAGIPPAMLQIVCDTLWRAHERGAGRIRMGDYRKLGGDVRDPAEGIYQRRVEEDLARELDAEQLSRFERLMPELRTANRTKRPKELSKLESLLDASAGAVQQLVTGLTRIGLVRQVHRYGADHIEWTTDYLAERTDALIDSTRRLYLLSRMRSAMKEVRAPAGRNPQRGVPPRAPLSLTELRELTARADQIEPALTDREAGFLLSVALDHDHQVPQWADIARRRGVELWPFLESTILDEKTPLPTVGSALRYLGQDGSATAAGLLDRALRQDTVATAAVEAIAASPHLAVLRLLAATLGGPLASHAVSALARHGTPAAADLLAQAVPHLGEAGLAAATGLTTLAADPGRPGGGRARELLGPLLATQAEPLFIQALTQGVEPLFWLQVAERNRVAVLAVLRDSVQDPAIPPARAQNAVSLLGQLCAQSQPWPAHALPLLEDALAGPVALPAARLLHEIGQAEPGRTGTAAAEAFDRVQPRLRELFTQALRTGDAPRFWFDRAADQNVHVWGVLGDEIRSAQAADTAAPTIRFLGELCRYPAYQEQALKLLGYAARQESLAGMAVVAITDQRSIEAVHVLAVLQTKPGMAERARRALIALAEDWRTPKRVSAEAKAAAAAPIEATSATTPTAATLAALTVLGRAGRSPDDERDDDETPSPADRGLPMPAPPAGTAGVDADPGGPRALPVPVLSRTELLAPVDPFTDRDWDRLLRQVATGACLPVLGAAAAEPLVPGPAQLARRWAAEYDYPGPDHDDLAAVAQFLAVTQDAALPPELVANAYAAARPPTGSALHRALAELPIGLYLTLGFDDLLRDALCELRREPHAAPLDVDGSHPDLGPATVTEPTVLHLHGHPSQPGSLVLTEDDHAALGRRIDRTHLVTLPGHVSQAVATQSWLVLGADPRGSTLRLLAGAGPGSQKRLHVAVLPPPEGGYGESRRQRYLGALLAAAGFRVCWSTLDDFAGELRRRWDSMGH